MVVTNGGTTDPDVQLSTSTSEEHASQQRQSADELMMSTEANLKKISGRQLQSTEQDMVNQIRNYMEQAKAAIAAEDLQRAQNLAFKAHLLSDELVKH